jgi:nicotinate phosphoribosyltransferase
MSLFDHRWLTNDTLQLDMDGIRRGLYSDRYFANVRDILTAAHANGDRFAGQPPRALPPDAGQIDMGNLVVEAQVFSRRAPFALVAGMDSALAVLRHCTGYFEGGQFVETWDTLDVEAVEDGTLAAYGGNPSQVTPVLKIRGRYRDFALLETVYLGVLARASRIATNVYDVARVASGKPLLFFPARFDVPAVQAGDGYAYWIGIQRANLDFDVQIPPVVSTDAQGAWWGGKGGGTIPHALIAAFLGDTAEATVAFARTLPLEVPRIALVDFHNDTTRDAVATLTAFWPHYRAALRAGDTEGQRRWTLDGVRLDTSGNMVDAALQPDGPKGVNPLLVRTVRRALDDAWRGWALEPGEEDVARAYCRRVQIVVSGGFDRDKIARFEAEGVPVDVYGVGSTFLQNDSKTNTDYSMDIVRVQIGETWVDMAKTGRAPNDNPDLRHIDLSTF